MREPSLIFQQDNALLGQTLRQLPALRQKQALISRNLPGIRPFEESKTELEGQNAPHCIVYPLFGNRSLADERIQIIVIAMSHHVHVQTGA